MSFDYTTLIADRTAADVAALKALLAKPLSQWTAAEAEAFNAAALKGSYDYTDLNRVIACMEDLAGRLTGLGYQVPGYAPVRSSAWTASDAPTAAQMEQYRGNVAAVRRVLTLPSGTEAAPESMAALTVPEANAMESILRVVDQTIQKLTQSWYYSGEVYAGEI